MRLYQVIPNFHSDSIHAVIAENECEAIDAFVEYLSSLHQSYKASDFSVKEINLDSVHHPLVIH